MNPVNGQVLALQDALLSTEDGNGKKIKYENKSFGYYEGKGSDGILYCLTLDNPNVKVNTVKLKILEEEEKAKKEKAELKVKAAESATSNKAKK